MSRSRGSVLSHIGQTPLIQLRKIPDANHASVYAKLEASNPSGSVKDRAALAMVEDAESQGLLRPGHKLVEPSSGNMGISLAMVAAAKGYLTVVTIPENAMVEQRRLLARYGAEIEPSPAAAGMRGAVEAAQRLAELPDHLYLDQFRNPANSRVHRQTTAQEVLEEAPGTVNAFVAGVGTGGTLTGVGEVLKERDASTLIVAVQPAAAPVLTGGLAGNHLIAGIGPDFIPPILNQDIIDEVIDVTEDDAFEMMRRLARHEGLLVGASSGANVAAAVTVARRIGPNGTVVTILPDTGERYLNLPE